jgi:serine protease Do
MNQEHRLTVLLVIALAAVTAQISSTASAQYSRRTPIVVAVEKTRASIVAIKAEKRNSRTRTDRVVGTGIIVDARGYVVTNCHVVADAAAVRVCLQGGGELDARILVEDNPSDLAILQVQTDQTLPALALGPGSDLLVGETVIAVGHPFGYTHTVSTGIISALGREITMPNGEVLTNLIQTNASINPGNSGGPLLNINGEVIGINVALREGAQGIAFAINADTVKTVLSKRLSAVWMCGVNHGLTCTENVAPEGPQREHVVVEAVASQTPAAAAGVKQGDEIIRVAGLGVSNRFDLERALWNHKPGDQIALTVVRAGKQMNMQIKLTPPTTVASGSRP